MQVWWRSEGGRSKRKEQYHQQQQLQQTYLALLLLAKLVLVLVIPAAMPSVIIMTPKAGKCGSWRRGWQADIGTAHENGKVRQSVRCQRPARSITSCELLLYSIE